MCKSGSFPITALKTFQILPIWFHIIFQQYYPSLKDGNCECNTEQNRQNSIFLTDSHVLGHHPYHHHNHHIIFISMSIKVMMIDDDDNHHQSHEIKPSRPLETSHCVAVEGVADCKVPDHHHES